MRKRLWRGVTLVSYVAAGGAYVIAWLPTALWCSAIVGALRGRLAVGRWPVYDQTMPAHVSLATWPGAWVDDVALLVSVTALSVLSAFLVHRLVRPRWTWVLGTPVVLGLGWGVYFVLLWLDPGGIFSWWLD